MLPLFLLGNSIKDDFSQLFNAFLMNTIIWRIRKRYKIKLKYPMTHLPEFFLWCNYLITFVYGSVCACVYMGGYKCIS